MTRQIAKAFTLAILFPLLAFAATSRDAGQQDFDLEVTVQTPSGPVRGGESFSFTATVRNAGPSKAVNVILISSPDGGSLIKSAHPSSGSCRLPTQPTDRDIRCSLGDLEPYADVTVEFGVRVLDFDSVTYDPKIREAMIAMAKRFSPPGDPAIQGRVSDERTSLIATLYAAASEVEANDDNNNIGVRVDLRPSANRAPKLEIISPRRDEVLIRPAKRRTTFTLKIRAVDPDGEIDRVLIEEKPFIPTSILEDGEYKFLYQGKTYTAAELDNFLEENPRERQHARRIDKDTFAYPLTDPDYGYHSIGVAAYDTMGRSTFTNVVFAVEGDATVEILSPKQNDVVEPGSTVTVEIASKLNEGKLKEVNLFGAGNPNPVSPQLVSKQGNVYRHRYVWKSDPAYGAYVNLRAMIVEDSGAMRNSEQVHFIIRKRPVISITSIKDGDVFSLKDTVRIGFTTTNAEPSQEYTVRVDERIVGITFSNETTWRELRPGIHVVQVIARHDDVELSRSQPVTIRVN